ncbi:GAF domain-containing protein [Geothrix sp. 21YS21S-4]|uniref:GAF domain-containing protein n=1 Tax=Geothrix sp. 21YS21S-4 TaxID=3068889 RepID=UPI0027B95B55|nr:GAF domain-containing protein [Geothrix sp. 21YS21S-4]
MPYLSWMEGSQRFRHAITEDPCVLGRDPLACAVAQPTSGAVSRTHAQIARVGGIWWVKDLDSANGTTLNGLPLNHPQGNTLRDGDELSLGGWRMTFTEGFPSLDGVVFAERVGDLFEEVRPEPAQAMVLIRGVEMLYRSTEKLMREVDSDAQVRGLLEESLRLLGGDRGFLVMRTREGGWRTAHRVGDVQEGIGLSRSVLDYVAQERTAVLSNQPLADPRFGGLSLVELHRGSLLCAPMLDEGEILGALYLDRESAGRPFSRFDLAIFQAFVRQGSLALRQAMLHRRAMGQAEQQGELLRLRTERQRELDRHGELLAALAVPLRRIQGWADELPAVAGEAIRSQLDHLHTLLEDGHREGASDGMNLAGHPLPLGTLQEELARRWEPLVALRRTRLRWTDPPQGFVWVPSGPLVSALAGLVELMLMQMSVGMEIFTRWDQERGFHVLRLSLPQGLHGPVPDPWTQRVLQDAGVRWHWADQALDLFMPEGPDAMPEEPVRPLLGLISEDLSLLGLFQTVAEAGDLLLHPLEVQPPPPPLPKFRFLVVDAKGTADLERTIRAYRQHPSFATTPFLVVRSNEEETPRLIEAGATDWLAEGFRWEALHHRLQVLRGHTELQQRALAAERLESFRQMAGTLKHEINNPLAIISMQVEMLQRKYPEEVKLAKIGDMVDRIRALVQVLQKMRETPTEDYADGSSILKLG